MNECHFSSLLGSSSFLESFAARANLVLSIILDGPGPARSPFALTILPRPFCLTNSARAEFRFGFATFHSPLPATSNSQDQRKDRLVLLPFNPLSDTSR